MPDVRRRELKWGEILTGGTVELKGKMRLPQKACTLAAGCLLLAGRDCRGIVERDLFGLWQRTMLKTIGSWRSVYDRVLGEHTNPGGLLGIGHGLVECACRPEFGAVS